MTDYIKKYTTPIAPWERREAEKIISDFEVEATVKDGIVRWASTNRVPPQDVLALWHHVGKPFDFAASSTARDTELSLFLERYRHTQKTQPVSDEQMSEMRAAFGPGVTVVDVLSGRRVCT